MEKVIAVRIYRYQDMDLMSMKMNKSYSLGREMKRALVAYANGKEYIAPEFVPEKEATGYVPISSTINIRFNTKDPEQVAAIKMLSSIMRGLRCGFIKTVFRSYCKELPLTIFSQDSGYVIRRSTVSEVMHIRNVSLNENNANEQRHEVEKQTKMFKPTPVYESVCQEPEEIVTTSTSTFKMPESVNQENYETDDFDVLFGAMDALGHQ